MKKKYIQSKMAAGLRARHKGQTMVVVAVLLGLGVLIGLVAIAVDGGSVLLQKRVQQNAADAGVLAGIDLMAHNLSASCNPSPCHPTYRTTNAILLETVGNLVRANRGGAVGADDSNYSLTVEYHYMAGAPPQYAPCASCYQPVPVGGSNPYIPEFVDGLRVQSKINNPTTFARALSLPIGELGVSAYAASRLNPICSSDVEVEGAGAPPPFTRFRAALEYELNDPGRGNSLCHPFEFWTPQGDLGGGNGQWKNVVSFNTSTFNPYQSGGTQIVTQTLSGFDSRSGSENPLRPWPDSGLSNYDHAQIDRTLQICNLGLGCANMAGSLAQSGQNMHQDFGNWIFWNWRGTLSLTSIYPIETNTRYPSTQATRGGTEGTLSERPGDWAEIDYTGNLGQNIQDAVYDTSNQWGVMTAVGQPENQGGLNWGRVLTRTVYLWGEPQTQLPSSESTQQFSEYTTTRECNPPSPGCTITDHHPAWIDVTMSGTYGNYVGSDTISRVRFTRSMSFLFYANLQGNYGARPYPEAGCSLPSSGSSAWGILPSIVEPPPPGGGSCQTGWEPGGGVYSYQVPPENP